MAKNNNKSKKEENFRADAQKDEKTNSSNKSGNNGRRFGGHRGKPGKGSGSRQNHSGGSKSPDAASLGFSSNINDFSWYNNYPELIESAARLHYPKIPGMNLTLPVVRTTFVNEDGIHEIVETGVRYQNIPGVMAIGWAPTVGASNDAQSPASICAKELYARVRAKFSGSLDEDAPDLFMYMVALDSAFAMIGQAKKIYRCLNAYNPLTTNTPDGVLVSMGFTQAQINKMRSERTRMWGMINDMVHKTEKFICPNVMHYFTRHYWLSASVYSDADTLKAQMYHFVMKAYYEVEPYTDTGTSLKMKMIDFSASEAISDPIEYIRSNIEGALNALAEWDDGYTISGHLMRAFEGTSSFSVALLNEDEVLKPEYAPDVLMQIENTRCVIPNYSDFVQGVEWGLMNVTQDPTTNAVISVPRCRFDHVSPIIAPNSQYLINQRKFNVEPKDNIEATRLTNVVLKIGDTSEDDGYMYIDGGSEIVTGLNLCFYSQTARTWSDIGLSTLMNRDDAIISMLPFWDWHPIPIMITEDGTNPNAVAPLYMFDGFNSNTFNVDIFTEMHRVCLLSEFNAFNIAK